MQSKRLKTIPFLLLGFGFTGLQAQENVISAGGNSSGNGGSVSYTVGQVMYKTYSSTAGSAAEGVQQPYEISVITAIDETQGINLSVSAFPNPTSNNMTLEIKDFELSALSFLLYDMHGKLFQEEKIIGNQTSILMSNLAPGTYLMKVLQSEKEVKTFKIIKK